MSYRSVNDPLKEYGQWGYSAGASGTVVVAAGRRVVGIAASAGAGAGSVVIDGGDALPVPANTGVDIAPKGNLVAPTIVFDSTNSYFVETVHDGA